MSVDTKKNDAVESTVSTLEDAPRTIELSVGDNGLTVKIVGTQEALDAYHDNGNHTADEMDELKAICHNVEKLNPYVFGIIKKLTLSGADFKSIDRRTNGEVAVAYFKDNLAGLIGDIEQDDLAGRAVFDLEYLTRASDITPKATLKQNIDLACKSAEKLFRALEHEQRFDCSEINSLKEDYIGAVVAAMPVLKFSAFELAKAVNSKLLLESMLEMVDFIEKPFHEYRADDHHAFYVKQEKQEHAAHDYMLRCHLEDLIKLYGKLNRYKPRDNELYKLVNVLVERETATEVRPANLIRKYSYSFASLCLSGGVIDTNAKKDIRQLQEIFISAMSCKFPTVPAGVVRSCVLNEWDFATEIYGD